MNHHNNELEMRAGDFGWIVSADALYPDVTTLRDITAALRFEAREQKELSMIERGLVVEPQVLVPA